VSFPPEEWLRTFYLSKRRERGKKSLAEGRVKPAEGEKEKKTEGEKEIYILFPSALQKI